MEYIEIGYTQKTHGVGGELKIFIEENYIEDFLKNERIFLEVKGGKIPYFIEQLRGSEAQIVKFEDVETREAALLLQSRKVFLRSDDLLPAEERTLPVSLAPSMMYDYLKDYQLVDLTLGPIGRIEEVLEMPQQEMAALHYKTRYTLIPLHPALIVSIEKNGQIITMDLPEGLLD